MKMIAILFGIFIFFAALANEQCIDINFFKIPGHPVSKMHLVDQKLGNCYSYSSNLYINAFLDRNRLKKNKKHAHVSTLAGSYNYKKSAQRWYENLKASNLEGGHVPSYVHALNSFGACKNEVIESALRPFYKEIPPDGILNDFEKVIFRLGKIFGDDECRSDWEIKVVEECKKSNLQQFFDIDKFARNILSITSKDPETSVFSILEYVLKECEKKENRNSFAVKLPEEISKKDMKQDNFSHLIADSLAKNELPIPIGVDLLDLANGVSVEIDARPIGFSRLSHAMTIVGMSPTGSDGCLVLIYDSSGLQGALSNYGRSFTGSMIKRLEVDSNGKVVGHWIDVNDLWNIVEEIYLP